MTSIIILTYNRLDMTMLCIDSIIRNTAGPYEIIVVDNGSTDGTPSWLARQKAWGNIKDILLSKENLGVPAGWNQGMKLADPATDYYLVLNNDVVVPEGWLDRLIACAESADNIGAVGPMTNYVSGPQCIGSPYYGVVELAEYACHHAALYHGRRLYFHRLVGFCLLIKAEVARLVGPFDERFGRGNFEDDDYCRRVIMAGYGNVIAVDCFVHHYGSASWTAPELGEQLVKNERIFKDKWGLK